MTYVSDVEKERERIACALAEACRRAGMPFGSPIGQDPADGLRAALESALLVAYEAGMRDMRERAVQVARAFMLGETMTPEHPESWYRELDALGDAIGNRIAVLPLRAASQEGKP